MKRQSDEKKVTESVLLVIQLGRTVYVLVSVCECLVGELTSTPKVPSLAKSDATAAAAILPEEARITHHIRIPSAFLSLP